MCLTPNKSSSGKTAVGESVAEVETYLEHHIFTWTVQNCSLHLCSDVYNLHSSQFQLENSSTNWQIGISGKVKEFSLFLLRLENDEGPEVVEVNYKLTLKINEVTQFQCQKCESFEKPSKSLIAKDNEFELMKFLSSNNCKSRDQLVVSCEMFILQQATPSQSVPITEERSADLQELSFDLLSLYETGEDTDIVLQTSDGLLKAHKAVLVARSPYFADNCKDFEEKAFPVIPMKIMDKLLRYIYSGNLKMSPSDLPDLFTLNDAINKLCLPDLKEMFAARKMSACTEIEAENFEFKWAVKDFGIYGKYGYEAIKSPSYETSRGTWCLQLCPNGQEKYLNFEVTPINLSDTVSALIEVSIDTGDAPSSVKFDNLKTRAYAVQKLESQEKVHFSNFIEKNLDELLKQYLMPNGTLTLNVNLKMCLPQPSLKTSLTKTVLPANTSVMPGGNLNKLSEDLFRLLKEGHYSDLELELKDNRLKVHKAIIIARWPYLANKIDEQVPVTEEPVFSEKFLYSSVMQNVLSYVYSGKINLDEKSIISIGEVCFIADFYKLPKLRDLCYTAFKNALDVPNAHMLLLWAQSAYAEELVAVSLNYIKDYNEEIFASEDWLDCKELYPEMTQDAESWATSDSELP